MEWGSYKYIGKGEHVDNEESKTVDVLWNLIYGSTNINESLVNASGNTDLAPIKCQTEIRILESLDRIQLSSEA